MLDFDKYDHIPKETLVALYHKILYIRLVTEAIRNASLRLELKCPVHFSLGQEAASVGIGSCLKEEDAIIITYRSHAPYLAKGGNLSEMIAEIFNKKGGCVGGIGGSMQLSSPENNIFCTSIAGGSISIAVGFALAFKMQEKENVAVAFFGDGATEQGSFHESLNFASLRKLPVIFFCENNFYAVQAGIENTKANQEIHKIAAANNIPAIKIDGNNVLEVYEESKKAIEVARENQGPSFIEVVTYRWLEHVGPRYDYKLGYRPEKEVKEWMQKCPLSNFEIYLLENNILNKTLIAEMKDEVDEKIRKAWKYMEDSPYPKLDDVSKCHT